MKFSPTNTIANKAKNGWQRAFSVDSLATSYGCPDPVANPVRRDHRVSLPLSAVEHRPGRACWCIMEGLWLKTGNTLYHQMARFWTKVFALTFAIGVATGIVMEFEFGTNWATYSRFVGDVFGSALAAEGHFCVFPRIRLSRRAAVRLGQGGPQNALFLDVHGVPRRAFQRGVDRGGKFLDADAGGIPHRGRRHARARGGHGFLAGGFQSLHRCDRLCHTVCGAWCAGRVSRRERERVVFAEGQTSGICAQVAEGRPDAWRWARHCCRRSPATSAPRAWRKISRPSSRRLRDFTTQRPTRRSRWWAGWMRKMKRSSASRRPGLLSFLAHNDFHAPVTGLDEFKPEDRPPVQASFLFFHAMVGIGFTLIAIAALGFLYFQPRLAARAPLAAVDAGVLGGRPANRQPTRLVRRGSRAPAVDRLWRDADAGGLSAVVKANSVLVVADSVHVHLFSALCRFHLLAQRQNPARAGRRMIWFRPASWRCQAN